MSQCISSPESFEPLVTKLLIVNAERFSNYDNTVTFISSLKESTSFQKANAIYHMATLYQSLAGLRPANFDKGKAETINSFTELFNEDYAAFLDKVTSLYDVENSSLTLQDVINSIDALEEKKPSAINKVLIEKILTEIKGVISQRDYTAEPEKRTKDINDLHQRLKTQVISQLSTVKGGSVIGDTLKEHIEAHEKAMMGASQFVSLSEVESLDNMLVTIINEKDNFQVLEATKVGEDLVSIETGEVIPFDIIRSEKKARIDNEGIPEANQGENIFFESQIASGIQIREIHRQGESKGDKPGQKALASLSPSEINNGYRILAIKEGTVGSARVGRIKDMARTLPTLNNTTLETFPTKTQERLLSRTAKHTEVLTVSRPSDISGFTLIGEVLATGQQFYIFGPNNYTFLDNKNNTTPVDFTNPVHLDRVQKTSKKQFRRGTAIEELTLRDLQKLKESFERFKGLSEQVKERLADSDSGVDVTDLFKNSYGISHAITGNFETKELISYLEEDGEMVQSYKIIDIDTGTIDTRKVPLILQGSSGALLGSEMKDRNMLYSEVAPLVIQKDFLAPNERILIGDKQYDLTSYLNYLDTVSNLRKWTAERKNLTATYLITMKPDGTINHLSLNKKTNSYEGSSMITEINTVLDTIAKLNNGVITKEDAILVFEKLSQKELPFVGVKKKYYANQNFAYNDAKGKYEYAFEIILKNDARGRNLQGKDSHKFFISSAKLEAVRDIITKSEEAKILRGTFSTLNVDLTKADSATVEKFMSDAAILKASNPTNLTLKVFMDSVTVRAQEAFADLFLTGDLKSGVIAEFMNKMKNTNTEAYDGFMEATAGKNTITGVESPGGQAHLLAYEVVKRGSEVRRVHKVINNQNSENNVGNYKVRDTIPSREKIHITLPVLRDEIFNKPLSAEVIKSAQVKETAVAEVLQEVEKPETSSRNIGLIKKKNSNREVFSIEESSENVELGTEKQLNDSIKWVRDKVPQFKISEQDLSQLLNEIGVDGVLLGMFMDKMIYLNKSINSKGVVYHEAFHGVFRHLLNAKQRAVLIGRVKKDKRYSSRFTSAEVNNFAKRRNLVETNERLQELIAEEILAEGFQKFMNDGVKPSQSWFKRFVEMLKNLLKGILKNQDEITQLYSNISKGYYKNAQVVSETNPGEKAFELLNTRLRMVVDEKGEIEPVNGTIDPSDQRQMTYFLTERILNANKYEMVGDERKSIPLRTLFDKARKEIATTIYNVDTMIANNPGKEVIIKDRFEIGHGDISALLMYGFPDTMIKGLDFASTGRTEADLYYEEDELMAESLEVLYEQVKTLLRHVIPSEISKAENDTEDTMINEDITEELGTVEGKKSSDNDQFFNINNIDGMSNEMRRFLSLTAFEYHDEMHDIKYTKMVDGSTIFNTLMKITSDNHFMDIIPMIGLSVENRKYDGYINEANELEAVYKKINEQVYIPVMAGTANTDQILLFNQITDVFHNMELDVVKTVQNKKIGDNSVGIYGKSEEILTKKDVDNSLQTLLDNLRSTYKTKKDVVEIQQEDDKEVSVNPYLDNIANMNNPLSRIADSKEGVSILGTDIYEQEAALNRLVDNLQEKFKKLGLIIPKSLLRFSIIAIDVQENKLELVSDTAVYDLYQASSQFARNKQFLEKDFFVELKGLISRISSGQSMSASGQVSIFDMNSQANNKMFAILRSALVYVVKFDPSNPGSVVETPEGKPVYRYVKYTPAALMLQDVERLGLKKALELSVLHDDYLSDFFNDNPMLKDAMAEAVVVEDEAKMKEILTMMTYMDNMKFQIYSGMEYKEDGVTDSATNFGKLGLSEIVDAQITMFLDRRNNTKEIKLIEGTGANQKVVRKQGGVVTFPRFLTQNEASQTMMMVSARYFNFYANSDDNRHSPSDVMMSSVIQEYNRISREWSNFDRRVEERKAGHNRMMLNYNATREKDSRNLETNKENIKELRAYQFNTLSDMFRTGKKANSKTSKEDRIMIQFRDRLLLAARGEKDGIAQGTQWNELPADFRKLLEKELKGNLATYNAMAYNNFKKQLVKSGKLENSIDPRTKNPTIKIKGLQHAMTQDFKSYNLHEKGSLSVYPNQEAFLKDFFFNYQVNSMFFNQIIDGDIALSIENSTDYYKRAKSLVASGSTAKKGVFNLAIVDNLRLYMDKGGATSDNVGLIEGGQYDSINELEKRIEKSEIARSILERVPGREARVLELTAKIELLKQTLENLQTRSPKHTSEDVFDGQAITSVLYRMDMMEDRGLLSENVKQIFLASLYRRITSEEAEILKSSGALLNSQKTVYASREFYIKESETHINRLDVSRLADGVSQSAANVILKRAYDNIYKLRAENRNIEDTKGRIYQKNEETIGLIFDRDIKPLWVAKPHKEILHDILNSMEYHNTDMLTDPNATKKTILFPSSIAEKEGDYITLNRSTIKLPMNFMFTQVETSGVKDIVTAGIQSIFLLPADIILLETSILADLEQTNPEQAVEMRTAMDSLKKDVDAYFDTMGDVTSERKNKMLKMHRDKNGDLKIGKMIDAIRKELQGQESDSNTLKFFETDVNGDPKFNVNLPVLRKMFQYHFYSHYSKEVFSEKTAGSKYIHASSFGHKIIEDMLTGEIISSKEYDANPESYENNSRYLFRYPEITTEIDEQGRTVYIVEAIVPRPYFKTEQEEELWLNELNKMFGTRIPTEDKRSMIAFKIVDFIDGSYANTIILPQAVHLLAGSDFDVDTLYAHAYAYYKDITGNYHKYGSTTYYNLEDTTPEMVRFSETVHEAMTDKGYKVAIEKAKEDLKKRKVDVDGNFTFEQFTPADQFMRLMNLNAMAEMKVYIQDAQENFKRLEELKAEQQSAYDAHVLFIEQNPEDIENPVVKNQRKSNSKELREAKEMTDALELQMEKVYDGKSLKDFQGIYNRFFNTYISVTATLQAMAERGVPVTLAEHVQKPSIAIKRAQNAHLDSKLKILSSKLVFDHLYKNERTSTVFFKNIANTTLGRDTESNAALYNTFSFSGVINANLGNTVGKQGIEITAAYNKFLGLASSYGLVLKPEEVIWFLDDPDGIRKHFDKFGGDKSMRSIEYVGNILGMFADNAKDPIPVLLGLNDVNLNTTASMIGIGVDPTMAILMNHLSSMKRAVEKVQGSVISGKASITYSNALQAEQNEFLKAPKGMKNELAKELAILKLTYGESTSLDKKWREKVFISFTAPKGTRENPALNPEEKLTPEMLGFTVRMADGMDLSENAQEYLLLEMYRLQTLQGYEISKAGSVIGLMSTVKPSHEQIEKYDAALTSMKDNTSVFINSDLLFVGNSSFNSLRLVVDDLMEQSSKIFTALNPSFKGLHGAFKNLVKDQETLSDILVATIILNKAEEAARKPTANKDLQFLNDMYLEMLRPEYWFGYSSDPSKFDTLETLYDELSEKYPNNAFVNAIYLKSKRDAITSTEAAYRETNREGEYFKTYDVLEIPSRAKKGPDQMEMLNDGFNSLLYHPDDKRTRLIAKVLFRHEMIRTGLGLIPNRYIQHVNTDLFLPINGFLESFMKDAGAYNVLDAVGKQNNDETSGATMLNVYRKLISNSIQTNPKAIPSVNTITVQNPIAFNHVFDLAKNDYVAEDTENLTKIFMNLGGKTVNAMPEQATLNFSNPFLNNEEGNEIGKSLKVLAKKLGISQIISGVDNAETFSFPPILGIKEGKNIIHYYKVESIDGKSIGELLTDALHYSDGKEFNGSKVTYTLIQNSERLRSMSTNAFSLTEIAKFERIANGIEIPESKTSDIKLRNIGTEASLKALGNNEAEKSC